MNDFSLVEFTEDDFKMLNEALTRLGRSKGAGVPDEVWNKANGFVSHLLSEEGIFPKEEQTALRKDMDKKIAEMKKDANLLHDNITLLKAKLVKLKQAAEAERAEKDLLSGTNVTQSDSKRNTD